MQPIPIDWELTLVPYYPNEAEALVWYQDPQLCKQVDDIDFVYDAARLRRMYSYLTAHGGCWYIQYRGRLVGDASLQDNGEIAIVICRAYQNRHIGRRCVQALLAQAREKGMPAVKAHIYGFNRQSRRMFSAVGFVAAGDDWYIYTLN